MNCFINQLLYFGLMYNYTTVANTTSVCNNMSQCVNNMCSLMLNPQVDVICFMPDGHYINDTNTKTDDGPITLLIGMNIVLLLYSIIISGVALYNYKNNVDYYT